ncbi:MAG: 4Fe-4S dicluster domain-containing protein [Planctomycetes bacterium]|nr:4Fe-4S dicluster domain-containing protein [Planctomycetota bacterium]MCD7895278.1 4Fe-4S dicluster domain-containing protein [Planctomycetaceae bacterium]
MHGIKDAQAEVERISGINAAKCMRCGKCSASCPAFESMDVHPHKVVSMVADNDYEGLVNCETLWRCLSCFTCVERCPRDVQPANIIEAVRLLQIREAGENHMPPGEVPDMLDDELPQQAIVAAMRKYNK